MKSCKQTKNCHGPGLLVRNGERAGTCMFPANCKSSIRGVTSSIKEFPPLTVCIGWSSWPNRHGCCIWWDLYGPVWLLDSYDNELGLLVAYWGFKPQNSLRNESSEFFQTNRSYKDKKQDWLRPVWLIGYCMVQFSIVSSYGRALKVEDWRRKLRRSFR